MKRPTFFHGVIVAAVLALFASAVIATLTPFVGLGSVIRLVIPALGLAYLLYLLRASRERVGRVTTLTLWSALAAVTWWISPPLVFYVLIHVGAVWLVRSLYFYSGVLPALLDLGLNALSVCAAIWALRRSESAFLATWCFFLVQALYVAIPSRIGKKPRPEVARVINNEGFERARRQADAALKQLFNA